MVIVSDRRKGSKVGCCQPYEGVDVSAEDEDPRCELQMEGVSMSGVQLIVVDEARSCDNGAAVT